MLTIIDYGVGNLTSIQNMLKKAGKTAIISSRIEDIEQASKLILPGMGAFDNCMEKLELSGLRPVLENKSRVEKIPILGICVGLQMFMQSSEEGSLPGLGWIPGKTVRFDQAKMDERLKVPNMGWLEIISLQQTPISMGLDNSRFYFAHSYHVKPENNSDCLFSAFYGYEFTAGIEHENLIGVQFHPEKSHKFGLSLLGNFANNY